ncbi:hypothetical protein MMC19_005110 [Ptychographa xylographoides]|nr:hypothetical protein [Ptychographa xylographoides]
MPGAAALVVPAVKKHTATVIFAHGLGDSGAGWMPLAQNWRRRGKFEEVAFIFPNAPQIPITVVRVTPKDIPFCLTNLSLIGCTEFRNENARLTTFNDLQNAHDEAGILKSRDYFNALIKQETEKGIPSSRIVVGGFSQGGAIAVFTGLTSPVQLGGFFGLSAYLLMHNKIKDFVPTDNPNKTTPVFMGHGDADPTVRYEWGQMTAKVLQGMGWAVDFRTYKGLEHSADPEEIDDLEAYLVERLSPPGDTVASKA